MAAEVASEVNAGRPIVGSRTAVKPGLVYDESRLNTERISVAWVSANTWGVGSIYGLSNLSLHGMNLWRASASNSLRPMVRIHRRLEADRTVSVQVLIEDALQRFDALAALRQGAGPQESEARTDLHRAKEGHATSTHSSLRGCQGRYRAWRRATQRRDVRDIPRKYAIHRSSRNAEICPDRTRKPSWHRLPSSHENFPDLPWLPCCAGRRASSGKSGSDSAIDRHRLPPLHIEHCHNDNSLSALHDPSAPIGLGNTAQTRVFH